MRQPKLMVAVALLALIALASTMTYTGFLVIGVLAEYLTISRFLTGLLLGVLFARVPSFQGGKLRTVGLLPKPARRPVMVSFLAVALLSFVQRADYVAAGFMVFAMAFLLTFPLIKRAVVGRMASSVFKFAPGQQQRRQAVDENVIDGDFREKKD